jgi:outer membrane protein assembly factor BamB
LHHPKPDYLYGMHRNCLLILFFIPLIGISQPVIKWRKALKGNVQSINSAVAIAPDKNGNVFIAGTSYEADSAKKILLVKLDSSGTEMWKRIYQADSRNDAIAVDAVADLYGNSIITGTVKNEAGNTDIITMKFSPDGILVWQNIYAGKAGLFDAPTAIAVDKKGNVFVCGHEASGEANPDLVLLRYNLAGEQSYTKNFASPKMEAAVNVMTDDSCNVFVCGNIYVSTRTADIIVMKFDSTGNQKWSFTYDGPQHAVDICSEFAFDDSSNIFITGSANHSNDKSEVPLIRINKNGKLISEYMISEGVSDGVGSNLLISGKSIFVQTVFTDFMQQTVTSSIQLADKNCKPKHRFTPESEDVTYIEAARWGNSVLLFGSILFRPENTIAPYIELVDSMQQSVYTFKDEGLVSLLRIKDVLLNGRDIYFLADDATDNAGTISVSRYQMPEEPKKISKANSKKK